MSDEANQRPEPAQATFTVKSLDIEARQLARRCSNAAGLTMGEWLAKAIRAQARIDLRQPEPRQPAVQLRPVVLDFGELRQLAEAVELMSRAGGKPISSRMQGRCLRLIDDQVRAAIGEAPRKLRARPIATLMGHRNQEDENGRRQGLGALERDGQRSPEVQPALGGVQPSA